MENGVSFSVLQQRLEEKGELVRGKLDLFTFASLNLQPQNSKVCKKVAREGKRDITSGDVDGMIGKTRKEVRGCPTHRCWKRRERWAKLRASRADRKRQTDGKKGNRARRRLPAAFMGVCSKAKRQKMNFSNPEKLQESCRLGRAAKGMFCSSAIHVTAA